MSTASLNFQTPPIDPLPPKRKKINYAPSYLYQKGNIFYFRYRFSSKEKELFQHAEIRVSLKTGFIKKAKRLARHLRAKLEGLIMEDLEKMDYSKLKKKMAIELKKLMDLCPEKNPPSLTEIKSRMNLVLQKCLTQIDSTLEQPKEGYEIHNGKLTQISAEQTLQQSFAFLKLFAYTPEGLINTYYPQAIFELLKAKIFTPDELTETNIPVILNEYHKMQISLNRILYEREKGNYAYEKQFTVPTAATPHTVSIKPNKQEQPAGPTLFEALESYINEKLRMKSWTERTQGDFIKKLTFFCQQVTNIPVGSITKQHIREVKDIIDKLPAGYSSTYKKHTLEEIKAGAVPLKDRSVPATMISNNFL